MHTALLAAAAVAGQPAAAPAINAQRIRELISPIEFKDDERAALRAAGGYSAAALDVYAGILAEPDDHWPLIERALRVLNDVECDRRRLIPAVVAKLAHPHLAVRSGAAGLLGTIGSAREAAPLVVVLSDPEPGVGYAAARSLARVGGDRELAALDLWLKLHPKAYVAEAVSERRDELKARLDKEAKGKPVE